MSLGCDDPATVRVRRCWSIHPKSLIFLIKVELAQALLSRRRVPPARHRSQERWVLGGPLPPTHSPPVFKSAPCGAGSSCPFFFGVIVFAVPKGNRSAIGVVLGRHQRKLRRP